MASMRLTFLYPHLFRSLRVGEPVIQAARQRCTPTRQTPCKAAFATTTRTNPKLVRRHGKAVEPLLSPGQTEDDVKVYVPENVASPILNAKNDGGAGKADAGKAEAKDGTEPKPQKSTGASVPLSEETQQASLPAGERAGNNKVLEELTPLQQASLNTEDPNASLNRILHMDPPSDTSQSDSALPHLHPPPYVHHFDSYTLVKQVEEGGFTPEQSVTAMKAVRGLLSLNLEIAKEGLVSKSDVENDTYLFRAACSELKTEIQNSRRASEEQMRRERILLQHEVDILNQKLSQELLALKDELTGMFNDRKMEVRMEQRSMESKIQELNYKITVALNSDSKSEVEGLRWVLTRRAVTAIVFMAFMVLLTLRYASYLSQHEELERKKREKEKEKAKSRGGNVSAEMSDGETQTMGDLPAISDIGPVVSN